LQNIRITIEKKVLLSSTVLLNAKRKPPGDDGNSKVVDEGGVIARMWCLVSQANSVILEVQVDPKAIGQECLEKVSVYFCRLKIDRPCV